MSDDKNDDDAEVAVLLPVVPKSVEADPLLLALVSCAAFLDLSTEEAVDPDDAVDVLELVGGYIQRLPEDRLEQIKEQLEELAEWATKQEWPEETVEFVRDFLFNCGVTDGEQDEDEDDEDEDDEDEDDEDEEA
jgi:hypothetical protein